MNIWIEHPDLDSGSCGHSLCEERLGSNLASNR